MRPLTTAAVGATGAALGAHLLDTAGRALAAVDAETFVVWLGEASRVLILAALAVLGIALVVAWLVFGGSDEWKTPDTPPHGSTARRAADPPPIIWRAPEPASWGTGRLLTGPYRGGGQHAGLDLALPETSPAIGRVVELDEIRRALGRDVPETIDVDLDPLPWLDGLVAWALCPEHGPRCAGDGECCCSDRHPPADQAERLYRAAREALGDGPEPAA